MHVASLMQASECRPVLRALVILNPVECRLVSSHLGPTTCFLLNSLTYLVTACFAWQLLVCPQDFLTGLAVVHVSSCNQTHASQLYSA